ncbi:MAG: SHOCT domain-containing protein [Lachnospiraceae bacterium]|nr:SHOCT domain-containing protein [Lachnospiraceae bacterium]
MDGLNTNEIEQVLRMLSDSGKTGEKAKKILDSELSLPNIPFPTMGGEVFWTTEMNYDGWRMQQNMVTKHARIIDPNNIRIAWGTYNGMVRAMKRVISTMKPIETSSSTERQAAMDELAKLKELLDMGAITENEYNEKKRKIMSRI